MTNLKRIRMDCGLSQSQLATQSGINVRMIQYYEQQTKDINKAEAATVYLYEVFLRFFKKIFRPPFRNKKSPYHITKM